jgi:hypothetical protein
MSAALVSGCSHCDCSRLQSSVSSSVRVSISVTSFRIRFRVLSCRNRDCETYTLSTNFSILAIFM